MTISDKITKKRPHKQYQNQKGTTTTDVAEIKQCKGYYILYINTFKQFRWNRLIPKNKWMNNLPNKSDSRIKRNLK